MTRSFTVFAPLMLYCVKHDVCFGIDSDIDHHVIEMSTDQFNPSRMYLFFSLSLVALHFYYANKSVANPIY